jgi:hypothetical protein
MSTLSLQKLLVLISRDVCNRSCVSAIVAFSSSWRPCVRWSTDNGTSSWFFVVSSSSYEWNLLQLAFFLAGPHCCFCFFLAALSWPPSFPSQPLSWPPSLLLRCLWWCPP